MFELTFIDVSEDTVVADERDRKVKGRRDDPAVGFVDRCVRAGRSALTTLVAAPVLVLAGYRDTEADSATALRAALADLERGRCRRIPLAGFDDAELTRLIKSITRADEEPGVAEPGMWMSERTS